MRSLLVLVLLAGTIDMAGAEVLVDLDLAAADGRPPAAAAAAGLVGDGVAWTADGLFLPAAAVARVPREYPLHEEHFPAPRAPYRADLALPLGEGRAVTVTLVACLATTGGDQDNLFSLGARSRWLSAQVGPRGQVIGGLDNRWTVLAGDAVPPVADRRWHAISVGLGAERMLRLAVDGSVADLVPGPDRSRFPPRLLADDPPVLSFADPGSKRHLHGLVRRLVVHRGLLAADAIAALHASLAVAALPAPSAAAFAQAKRPGPPPENEPDAAPTGNANNF